MTTTEALHGIWRSLGLEPEVAPVPDVLTALRALLADRDRLHAELTKKTQLAQALDSEVHVTAEALAVTQRSLANAGRRIAELEKERDEARAEAAALARTLDGAHEALRATELELAAARDRPGAAQRWVETLRKADKECIERQKATVETYASTIRALEQRCASAQTYVQACLAIREAPYPSQVFTKACTAATEAYHGLLAAYGETGPDA